MADISVDCTGDDAEVFVSNHSGFDLRVEIAGLVLDISADQAQALWDALRPYFDGDEA